VLLGRPMPLPVPIKILIHLTMPFVPQARRKAFREFMAYVLLEPC